jgi:recombination protein RecA
MALSPAQNFHSAVPQRTRWTLPEISGRLVEVSSSGNSAALTIVFGLVRAVQERREPVGWVTSPESFFYPPDAACSGVDLAALAVVRTLHMETITRAGEKLLRSGGFGLIVLDLGNVDIPMPLQSRLAGLAQHHHAALVCLTTKASQAYSLGSLVSLRVHAERKRNSPNRFACGLRVLKDKRRGPTWTHEEFCDGPAGLC